MNLKCNFKTKVWAVYLLPALWVSRNACFGDASLGERCSKASSLQWQLFSLSSSWQCIWCPLSLGHMRVFHVSFLCPMGEPGRAVGTLQEGSFPHIYFISPAVLTVTFPGTRNGISGVPSSSEICTGEMEIATPWCFSEYHIHRKWRSHCCISKLEFIIGVWGIWWTLDLCLNHISVAGTLVHVVISWCSVTF